MKLPTLEQLDVASRSDLPCGHSGGAVDALDPGQNYPETVPSLKASANKYYYTSNGKDAKGAEYVTILWRVNQS